MQNFELTKHQVTEVNFRDNGRQKKGESSFDISGSVLLPKDGKGIIFEQEVHLGKPEENVYLYLKTLTFFAQIDESKPFVLEEANKKMLSCGRNATEGDDQKCISIFWYANH